MNAEKRQGDATETESALTVYTVIVPAYNISFSAFQTPVGVIEPNPNWSAVGLRDYKTDWPWGPWLQQRDPQPQTGA